MKINFAWLSCFFLAGFLVYGSSLSNPFVFDDDIQVLNNSFVHDFEWQTLLKGSTFASNGKETLGGIYYKPLLPLLYGVLWNTDNGSSFPFHLFQLLLAIANAFLFFYLLKEWIAPTAAGLTALLFLLHPINSEVVLYIADLQEVLFMFWGLLALVLLKKKVSWVFVSLCLFMSLLSKETGFLFILL